MEEYKITGIILSAKDYKDNDKLVCVFSLELGKIYMQLKGVKKQGAKLKSATLPFCFANFVAVASNNFFIISQIDVIDSFFSLTKDYDKMVNASVVLKVCDELSKNNVILQNLFIYAINTLKIIAYENMDCLALVKFLLLVLKDNGYEMQFNKCNSCNCLFGNTVCLNTFSGTLTCTNCGEQNSLCLTKQEFTSLKIINNTNFEQLATIKFNENVIKNLLFALKKSVENIFSIKNLSDNI